MAAIRDDQEVEQVHAQEPPGTPQSGAQRPVLRGGRGVAGWMVVADDDRTVPISTRLAAVLQMANLDPAGRRYPPSAHVFGALGEPVKTIKRAWETCVLRAHGHEPQWLKGGKLSAESRAALAEINLHFHDLRHEAGSRWLEAGMPLHHIKEILGHANISQTDTYLNAGRIALQDSMRRFDAARGKPVAKSPVTEQRPVGHAGPDQAQKDPLH